MFLQVAIDNTSDPESLVAIWDVLIASSAQGAVVHAAITHCLKTPEDRQIFDEAWRAFGKGRRLRNKFAHSLWAFAEGMPDVLLLVEPTHIVAHDARLEVERRAVGSIDPGRQPEDILDASKVMVYTLDDLRREARDMDAILSEVTLARWNLIPLPVHDVEQIVLPGLLEAPPPESKGTGQSPP